MAALSIWFPILAAEPVWRTEPRRAEGEMLPLVAMTGIEVSSLADLWKSVPQLLVKVARVGAARGCRAA